MTPLRYADLIDRLQSEAPEGIRWGLDRTRRILAAAGEPHRAYPTLHVGGTNGKGSVAATLAAVLHASGLRTGLYTSPHLATFRERIQVNGTPLGEDAVVEAIDGLWPVIRRERPSFFEATTAVAFQALADAGVEVAVVEVGLGGRLDATNVVTPELSIITNIALDHARFLGDTLADVAREKAGIIKPGVPVLTAEPHPEIRGLLRDHAAEVGAPFRALDADCVRDVRVSLDGTRFRYTSGRWGDLELHTPLVGRHQAVNAALSLRALELLPEGLRPEPYAAVRGLARVRWPGRLQVERVGRQTWVLDVAHNPASAEALASTLRALAPPEPRVVVAGILADKDWTGVLQPLAGFADVVILTTPPSAPTGRRWDPAAAARALPHGPVVEVAEGFHGALERAWQAAGAGDGGGTVVVTGSFYTVGDALVALGRTPHGADSPLPVCTFAA